MHVAKSAPDGLFRFCQPCNNRLAFRRCNATDRLGTDDRAVERWPANGRRRFGACVVGKRKICLQQFNRPNAMNPPERLPVSIQTLHAELADRAWTGNFREIMRSGGKPYKHRVKDRDYWYWQLRRTRESDHRRGIWDRIPRIFVAEYRSGQTWQRRERTGSSWSGPCVRRDCRSRMD